MSNESEKLVLSKMKVNSAIEQIFRQNPDFTGQFELEVHCKDGIVKDVYEIRKRRKI